MAFDLENYAPVGDRVLEFYRDHPDGSIRTFLHKHDGPEVIFEARLYRNAEDARAGIYTSGWAREVEGKSPVNRTSHLENAETSAIGRALANLGYATDARRPSREEMMKAARAAREHEDAIEYIRDNGARIPDGALAMVAGQEVELRGYIRTQWSAIKERASLAAGVAKAIEEVTTGAEVAS
jgi:hypothetical protein